MPLTIEIAITESNGGVVGNESSAIPDNCTRIFSPAPVTFPFSLTWEGHEFLDSIRDKSSWEKLKNSLGKNLSTIPVSALAAVTSEMAKEWALQKMRLK
ncbi:DUF2513 domain-containing protein [Paenibacillus polymyxa]|uniref:DUF2513 domain-containing protein n=1 Tax=Paenibacillus polymyxa TaxID=1406 RepID=UPI003B6715CF